jgi:hypothetical protein
LIRCRRVDRSSGVMSMTETGRAMAYHRTAR